MMFVYHPPPLLQLDCAEVQVGGMKSCTLVVELRSVERIRVGLADCRSLVGTLSCFDTLAQSNGEPSVLSQEVESQAAPVAIKGEIAALDEASKGSILDVGAANHGSRPMNGNGRLATTHIIHVDVHQNATHVGSIP